MVDINKLKLNDENKVEYNYLIVSAHNPDEYEDGFLYEVSGMHDDESFIQPVKCEGCRGDVYIMFDAYGLPEVGQCVECGKITEIYYKIDDWEGDWIRGRR
jgi:hypothetical protein